MMKFAVVLLAVLACGSAVPAPKESKTLADDWAEFKAMVPMDEILAIVAEYLSNDAQVQEIAEFLVSDEYEAMVLATNAEPTYTAILDHLEAQGVPVYDFINKIHDALGIPQIPKPMTASHRLPRAVNKGWREMWEEIRAILPLDDMYTLHCAKLEAAADWKTLYDSLQNEDFRAMVNAFRVTESWQTMIAKLAEYGVQTDLVVAAIQRFFNWDDDNVDYCARA